MKVAQILYSGLGGHGSVAFSLSGADRDKQWQLMMGFFGIEPLSVAYAETCRRQDIPYRYFRVVSGRQWRSWPKVLRWLEENRPETVILHSITALLPCWWYARRNGGRLVAVEHTPNLVKTRNEWVFSVLAMWLADRVVMLTPVYRAEMREALGWWYRDAKVRLIPNGIDTRRFAPVNAPDPETKGKVRLGMAARFVANKRQDSLVAMMDQLRRRRPDIAWELNLAGDGETWKAVETQVRASGLEDCVELTGHLDSDRLAVWFQSLDIYLHASVGETLSTSILQAMATGLPIVGADVPGIGNLLTGEHICGVLVPDSTPEGFCAAVSSLWDNPAERRQLAHAARRLAVKEYSQESMFERYHALVMESLSE